MICGCRGRGRRNRGKGGYRGFSSRSSGDFIRWRHFSGSNDPGDGSAYWPFRPGLNLDPGQNAIARGFDFHHRFVGFNLEQRLALGDRFTFFFQPRNKLASFLGHFERGHNHTDRHKLNVRGQRSDCRGENLQSSDLRLSPLQSDL